MTPRAALEAALPQEARKYISLRVDPADAWLAWKSGLTVKQANSQARNSARGFGLSWPDRLPSGCLVDVARLDLHAPSPLETLLAVEAAREALAAPLAPLRLAQADVHDADTRGLARACGITQRRAQQIKKSRLDIAKRQMPLFTDGEDEEGGEK